MSQIYGGRWKFLSQLGQGGQGQTTLVQDLQSGESGFVFKRLTNITRRARFEREIEALRRIDSPHVPKVLDVGEHKGRPFLVTRYAGKDLTKATLPDGVGERLKLFRQAVVGIGAAHATGLVHRDIKPDNIVINDQGVVGVIDFGICADEEDGAVILTTRIEGFGNRSFAAPECEPGSVEKASTPSDIYSLGKLLFWLMSGGKVVVRENFDATALLVTSRHELDYLVCLLRRTVAEHPHSRWSADELLEQIDWTLAKLAEHAEQAPSVVLIDTFGPSQEFDKNGNKSVTTPPHGNPPGDYDLAQRFDAGPSDCLLDHINLALQRYSGDGRFELQIVADNDGKPDTSPLAGWNEQVPRGGHSVISLRPHEPVPLSANQSYWVTLSASSPDSRIAWWAGIQNLRFLRTTIAKRADDGPWQPAVTSGPGYALMISAHVVN